jgi:hypothetical protein
VQLDADEDGGRRRERRDDAEQRAGRRRLARHVEASPVAQQRREEHERRDRLLEVEPLRQVRDSRCEYGHNRELPRAPATVRERTREPDERDPEGKRADTGGGDAAGREHPADDLEAVAHLGCERRGDANQADRGGGPSEQRLGPRAT